MYAHTARIGAYGVGFSVVVWMKGQCESLNQRNSKIAVPLLILCFAHSGFSCLDLAAVSASTADPQDFPEYPE